MEGLAPRRFVDWRRPRSSKDADQWGLDRKVDALRRLYDPVGSSAGVCHNLENLEVV